MIENDDFELLDLGDVPAIVDHTHLTEDEVDDAAWAMVINGAESYVKDALDEDGEFTDADYDRILKQAGNIIHGMREGDVGWL